LGLLVVDEFKHHFYFLKLAFVRSEFSSPIDHYFRHKVDHLEIRFHLLIRSWIDIWLDNELLAIFASLFPLREKMEWGWIKLFKISGLAVQISKSLVDVGRVIEIEFDL